MKIYTDDIGLEWWNKWKSIIKKIIELSPAVPTKQTKDNAVIGERKAA